jgi:hypothetical protein
MQPSRNGIHELQQLGKFPGIRKIVESIPEYVEWRDQLSTVQVDGEGFFVIGGDQLMDNDQILVEWIHLFRPELLED